MKIKERKVSAIYTGSSQSIPNATSTIINFATKAQDTHNAVTIGSSWQFKSPKSALYLVVAKCIFNSAAYNQSTVWESSIFVSGVEVKNIDYHKRETSNAVPIKNNGSCLVYLNKDDLLDYRVYQNNGAAASLNGSHHYNNISIVEM